MRIDVVKDQVEELGFACMKMEALIHMFSESYINMGLEEIVRTIQADPRTFSDAFSIIEDFISDIRLKEERLEEEIYRK